MSKGKAGEIVLVDRIEPCILLIRGQRVMLDADLAPLYGTSTKAFNQAIKRNLARFPADFMFQLGAEEAEAIRSQTATAYLRSQTATSSDPSALMRSQIVTASRRNVRYLPYAFTEHGAIMAASVLNTPRAIEVSVYVVRAFVKLREVLSTHKELAGKLAELERKVVAHDVAIQSLVGAIRRLMEPPPSTPPRRGLAFTPERRVSHDRGGGQPGWGFHGRDQGSLGGGGEMSFGWPAVPLGEILVQDQRYVTQLEPREYPKLSVKLYGKGVVLDSPAHGSQVKMARHQLARAGQVILSEIWGKKGAIGFVPRKGTRLVHEPLLSV